MWFGVPGRSRQRCADVIWAPSRAVPADIDPHAVEGEAQMLMLGYFNPPGYSSNGVVNTHEWRRGRDPVDQRPRVGDRCGADLRSAARARPAAVARPADGGDECAERGLVPGARRGRRRSVSASSPRSSHRPFGPNPRSFGHFGTGGALGFADPDAGVAFGYVMNHVIPRWQSTRNRALIDAVYA